VPIYEPVDYYLSEKGSAMKQVSSVFFNAASTALMMNFTISLIPVPQLIGVGALEM
jgi:hypothetical protein